MSKKIKPLTNKQLLQKVIKLESKIAYLERKNAELYKSISLRDDMLKQHTGLTDIEKIFLKTLRKVFTEK
jgi:hypothetical protein